MKPILVLVLVSLFLQSPNAQNGIEFKLDDISRWKMVGDELINLNTKRNLFIGDRSLNIGNNARWNIAIGDSTLQKTNNYFNIGIGHKALKDNVGGRENVALGWSALENNEEGDNNVAIGPLALWLNNSGGYNVAIGRSALNRNISGYWNIAIGQSALGGTNQYGYNNVAIGAYVLNQNSSGDGSIGIGRHALRKSRSKNAQIAIGDSTLMNNGDVFSGTQQFYNTAIGSASLFASDTGRYNTAIGYHAGKHAIGSGNVYLGYRAGENGLGNNKLYVSNHPGNGALIYGDFDLKYVGINDRLGVGLSSPARPLHVRGEGSTDEQTIIALLEDYVSDRPILLFSEGGSSLLNGMSIEYDGRESGDNNKLNFNARGGTPNMTILSGGNVGIGTTTPEAKFEVVNGEVRIPSGEAFPTHFNYSDGKNYIRGDTRFDHELEVNGELLIDGTAHLRTGSDVSPAGGGYMTLGQKNGLNIAIDNNEIMARNNNGLATLSLQAEGGDLAIHSVQPEIERIFIKSNGRVGIGLSNPGYKLDVRENNDAGYVAQIMNTHTSSNTFGHGLRIKLNFESGLGHRFIGFYDQSSSIEGRIEGVSGNGVTYLTSSDARLKENIQPMQNGLSLIRQLNPTTYNWKENGVSDMGFIAQELMNVIPNAVSGNPNDDVLTKPMAVDYGRVTPVLAAAIKELLEKVEKLEVEVAELRKGI